MHLHPALNAGAVRALDDCKITVCEQVYPRVHYLKMMMKLGRVPCQRHWALICVVCFIAAVCALISVNML